MIGGSWCVSVLYPLGDIYGGKGEEVGKREGEEEGEGERRRERERDFKEVGSLVHVGAGKYVVYNIGQQAGNLKYCR